MLLEQIPEGINVHPPHDTATIEVLVYAWANVIST